MILNCLTPFKTIYQNSKCQTKCKVPLQKNFTFHSLSLVKPVKLIPLSLFPFHLHVKPFPPFSIVKLNRSLFSVLNRSQFSIENPFPPFSIENPFHHSSFISLLPPWTRASSSPCRTHMNPNNIFFSISILVEPIFHKSWDSTSTMTR